MDIEVYRRHCIAKKGVTEEFPFDENTLVFKVMGKMFSLTGVDAFDSINIKVDPEIGIELREKYPSVKPGYHMNKKHWITVVMDGTVPDKRILQWIDNSYQLVCASLTKSQKAALESL
jgi:predicted DNA-binding protein (MmcQ/YjbR family)